MDNFIPWRERLRLMTHDTLPAILIDLKNWRSELLRVMADGSLASRIEAFDSLRYWSSIVYNIALRLRDKEAVMEVLDQALTSVFADRLDDSIVSQLLAKSTTLADQTAKQDFILETLSTYTQATAQKRITTWVQGHAADVAVKASIASHKNVPDMFLAFINRQTKVGIRDVWQLIGMIAPLYEATYQRTISSAELLAILRDDSFVKVLFTFAVSAAEVIDPLQKEMMIPLLVVSDNKIYDHRYFTLQKSGESHILKFSPYFYVRLKALRPMKQQFPIFTGCPLTYLKTKHNTTLIHTLARWCVDLAEIHYVPLFAVSK
jgi:hypothetical protein